MTLDSTPTPAHVKAGKIALVASIILTVLYAAMAAGQRGTIDLIGLVLAWATYLVVVFVIAWVALQAWRAVRR